MTWANAYNPRDPGPRNRATVVSFVPMPAVSDVEGTIVGHDTKPFATIAKGYTRFQEQDVIFAKITPCMENGKIAIASNLHGGLACGSTEFHVLRANDAIIPRYLWHFLRQVSFRRDAERHMTGAVGQRRVPAQYIKDAEIPLPPVADQRRIVSKVDSLFEFSKRAREELAHVPRLAIRYKQAVLRGAYHDAEIASAGSSTLGAVTSELRNGLSRRPENAPPGVPILKISAVRSMAVRMEERRYYVPTSGEDIFRYALQAGDLLFTRYNGNPDLVANCGMVHALDEQLVYPDKLIRVRVIPELVDPEFIEAVTASPQARSALAPAIKSAAGQHGISGADLKRLPIPLPTLSDQKRIVAQIRSALAVFDGLASKADRTQSLLGRLEQATLAKAFRGELLAPPSNAEGRLESGKSGTARAAASS